MTGWMISTWFCVNIIVTVGCYFLWSWSNDSLFTYLGDAEITPGNWEACYTYDIMTIPARIVAFLAGVGAIIAFVVTWAAFISVVLL